VIGEASDAASAYQCYKDTRPDVVIMDISMPAVAASINRAYP
jgi:YesN/AraC family two-component response regulator